MDQDFYNISKRVIIAESEALNVLSENIPCDLPKAINAILQTKGRVILIGMGKSGYIARKIASSLASTGTPAFYIHPGEASHGDLGMITKSDIVIMLSNSGETKELNDSIDYCKRFNIKIIAITMNLDSLLAKNSDFVLNLPQIKEASLLSAPTTSALMMLALGDSIIIALHETKNFSKDDYFNFHPGGKIGANLIKVKTLMRSGNLIPKVKTTDHFTDLIIVMTQKSLGCAAVIDDKNKLVGFITDGDLRRNIKRDLSKLHSVDIMNHSPLSIPPDTLVSEALFLMNESSITAIPITNQDKTLLGIIHIHDILKT